MNEKIILQMTAPYVKDAAITYDQFDNIFSMLSIKEQYVVVEILYKNGIDLVDEQIDEESFVLDVDEDGIDDFEILYDEEIFKDATNSEEEFLVINKKVSQSNEILCALIQEGNRQAEQDLCVKNKGLVCKFVSLYQKRYGNRLDDEDLEQAGYIGLLKAARKFDFRRGTAFSTYAVFWIKQSLSREIMDNGFAIRIPVHMMESILKVMAEDAKLLMNDENMSLEERISRISSKTGLEKKRVMNCMVLRQNYMSYVSLDMPIGEDESSLLMDFIPDTEGKSLEQLVEMKLLKKDLEEIISTLREREAIVINQRFGLDDGKPKTLEEVGRQFNVTRERIRQIEKKALRKMRHPSRSKKLKDYLL